MFLVRAFNIAKYPIISKSNSIISSIGNLDSRLLNANAKCVILLDSKTL